MRRRLGVVLLGSFVSLAFVTAPHAARAQDRPIVQRCALADEDARVVKQRPLALSSTARSYAAKGYALVKVLVVYRSTGYALLDASAVEAARASTFAPGIASCRAVRGAVLVRYDFK